MDDEHNRYLAFLNVKHNISLRLLHFLADKDGCDAVILEDYRGITAVVKGTDIKVHSDAKRTVVDFGAGPCYYPLKTIYKLLHKSKLAVYRNFKSWATKFNLPFSVDAFGDEFGLLVHGVSATPIAFDGSPSALLEKFAHDRKGLLALTRTNSKDFLEADAVEYRHLLRSNLRIHKITINKVIENPLAGYHVPSDYREPDHLYVYPIGKWKNAYTVNGENLLEGFV